MATNASLRCPAVAIAHNRFVIACRDGHQGRMAHAWEGGGVERRGCGKARVWKGAGARAHAPSRERRVPMRTLARALALCRAAGRACLHG
eukprot:364118-Chlamydomonas_euryale.AAC.1